MISSIELSGINVNWDQLTDKANEALPKALDVVSIIKFSMKSVGSKVRKYSHLLRRANQMSALSIVPAVAGPYFAKQECDEMAACQKVGDFEGAGVAGLAALTITGGSVDSFITFSLAMNELERRFPCAPWFESVLIPLGLVLCGFSFVLEGVKIHNSRELVKKLGTIEGKQDSEYTQAVEEFLESSLGVPSESEITQQKKEKKFTRMTSKEEVEKLKELQKKSFSNDEAKELLSNVKSLQKRKIQARWVSVTAIVVTVVALSLFLTPVGLFVPYALFAGVIAVNLGLSLYEKKYLTPNYVKKVQ